MKKIIINDREFEYETCRVTYGEDVGSDMFTYFYEGTETITRRKWLIFGPKIKTTQPRCVFTILGDSEDPLLTKDWWRSRIEDKIKILNRVDELDRGELC